jgi:hypothetical protein
MELASQQGVMGDVPDPRIFTLDIAEGNRRRAPVNQTDLGISGVPEYGVYNLTG